MFEGLNRLVDLQALATGRGTEAERAFRGMSILDVASETFPIKSVESHTGLHQAALPSTHS